MTIFNNICVCVCVCVLACICSDIYTCTSAMFRILMLVEDLSVRLTSSLSFCFSRVMKFSLYSWEKQWHTHLQYLRSETQSSIDFILGIARISSSMCHGLTFDCFICMPCYIEDWRWRLKHSSVEENLCSDWKSEPVIYNLLTISPMF